MRVSLVKVFSGAIIVGVLFCGLVGGIAFCAEVVDVTVTANGDSRKILGPIELDLILGPGDDIEVEVKVHGRSGEAVWVGATVYIDEYSWQDFPAERIEFSSLRRKKAVDMIITLRERYFEMVRSPSVMKLIVALWERKGYCDCRWCKRNGYHMEERIDSVGPERLGTYFPRWK